MVLSFEFALLNYRAPEQNRYRYRMEGFEKEWNEVDKLEMKNQSLPEPEREKLRQIARDIGTLSSDIHMISRRLHPISLEILGLVRSIETECRNFTRLKEIPILDWHN